MILREARLRCITTLARQKVREIYDPMIREFFLEEWGISYRMNEFCADKKSIVFIHGVTGSCSAWFRYEEAFQDNFNLLTFDLRGHGKSRKYGCIEDYSVERCAEDIIRLLNHTNFENFSIVSHSFGTLIGVELLAKLGGRVDAAIFLCPAYGLNASGRRFLLPILDRLAAIFGMVRFSIAGRRRTDYSRFEDTGDWNIVRMFADIRNTTFHVHVFCLRQIYQYDQSDKWEFVVPTLVIHGRNDTLIPVEVAIRLQALKPSIKLIVLDGADHILILNQAKLICREILNFLSGV